MALGVGRLLNGAPFASLFLILGTVCLASIKTSEGLRVDIAVPSSPEPPPEQGGCGDGRLLVLRVGANGGVRLNSEDLEMKHLARRLKDVFSTRVDRVIFILPDENCTFGQVAAVIDVARLEVNHVALLSHAVARNPGSCGPGLRFWR